MDAPSRLSKVIATLNPPLVRTDFTDDVVWQEIVGAITKPSKDGFLASLSIVDDKGLNGASAEDLAAVVSGKCDHGFLFVADDLTINHCDHPILCIELPIPGKSLRVIPAALWSVENNLSLANMDFEEFSGATDPDGIFRDF